jgi:ribosomal protein S6
MDDASSDAQALRLLRAFSKVEDRVLREKIVVLTESVGDSAIATRQDSEATHAKFGNDTSSLQSRE